MVMVVAVMVTVVAVVTAVVVSGRATNVFFDKNKSAPQKVVRKHRG